MMKRKFSFDMPRLKIGPTKSDNKALRDQLNSSPAWDSPPPTPKSVRPPLSPKTNAELRASCAYVLQNFKPSYAVFQDAAPTTSHATAPAGPKPQLDYAAIREASHSALELGPPLRDVDTSGRSPVTDGGVPDWNRRQEKNRWSTGESPVLGLSTIHNPRHAALRADELMGAPPSRPATSDRQAAHVRHELHGQSAIPMATPIDLVQRSKGSQRNASLDTESSTPFTDATEYPWSERASTAMTSAMVTPARSSKRTSQAMQFGSENGSMSQGTVVDGEWMRQELEKHRKAQEGFGQAEKLQEVPEAAETRTRSVATPAVSSAAVKAARRKSLPASAFMKAPKMDNATTSSKDTDIPQRTGRQPVETDLADDKRSRSRSRAASRISGRARSISRGVKDYLRPRSVYQSKEEVEVPQVPPPSRSRGRSVSRHVMNYIRPEIASESQKASMDIQRSASKARSVRSIRSTTSGFAPSIKSVAKKWRPWQRGSQDLQYPSEVEISRPDSAQSELRGRAQTRGSAQSTKRKSRVDLNHELPPLPSLDTWRPSGNESPHNNRASASKDSVMSLSVHQTKHPVSRYSNADEDEVVPTRPSVQYRSHRTSEEYLMDSLTHNPSRRAMASVQRYIPTTARDQVGTASSPQDVQSYRPRWPVESTNSSGAVVEHTGRQRAKTARGPPPQSYREPRALYEPQQVQVQRPAVKPQLVNFSRPGNAARAVSQEKHIVDAHVNSTGYRRHSRVNSDQTKSSQYYRTDGYGQAYSHADNVVNDESTRSRSKPTLSILKEKSSWKWWSSKHKQQETLSDPYAISSARDSHSPTYHGAAAPIIRY